MKGKSKSKIFFPNLILLLIGLGVVLFGVYSVVGIGLKQGNKTTVLNTLENKYYVVGKDPTKLQKEKFELLSEKLKAENVNQLEIADLVAQSFVIDFFNWSNKEASYDVGGLQYMYDPSTFNNMAHFEYYQKVDVFNSTYGKNNLPNITEVKSKTDKTVDYELGEEVYPAYKSKVTWTYANSSKLDVNEFISEVELTLIDIDGKIVIADVIMIDEEVETDE